MNARKRLEERVAEEFDRPVSPGAHALTVAARERHPDAVAVLFYGSCLRGADDYEGVLDLYVLVDRYEQTYDRRVLVWLNRVLPPNVFYLETTAPEGTVRAMFAVVELASFVDFMDDSRRESYFWGRFSQPVALVWATDSGVRDQLARGCATAVATFVRNALALVPVEFSVEDLWVAGLSRSYNTELRSEGPDRSAALFATFADYYWDVTQPALELLPFDAEVVAPERYRVVVPPAERRMRQAAWRRRGVTSKLLSLLRILRNGYTVDGGPEYVMWKIERHTDFRFDKTWRDQPIPLLALAREAWRAWRAGAFR